MKDKIVNYVQIVYDFTDREIEVVELLITGKTFQEVAKRLNIGSRTIETYVESVKKKLGVNTLCQLGATYTRIKYQFKT